MYHERAMISFTNMMAWFVPELLGQDYQQYLCVILSVRCMKTEEEYFIFENF